MIKLFIIKSFIIVDMCTPKMTNYFEQTAINFYLKDNGIMNDRMLFTNMFHKINQNRNV